MVARPSWAVVVPMFNESAGARRCVDRVTEELLALDTSTTLVVVDDGSADDTVDVLRRALDTGRDFELVEGGVNRGYGGALRLGAERAVELGLDWVLFMDSDLTNPPEQIREFIDAATDRLTYIKACRYCRGGATGNVPWTRVVVSRWGNRLARLLTGLRHRDLTNGFRAFRATEYVRLPLTERGFAVILEEMHWAKRFHWVGLELPTTLTDRDPSLRRTSFRYTPSQVWKYLRWPLRTFAFRLSAAGSRRRRPDMNGESHP